MWMLTWTLASVVRGMGGCRGRVKSSDKAGPPWAIKGEHAVEQVNVTLKGRDSPEDPCDSWGRFTTPGVGFTPRC